MILRSAVNDTGKQPCCNHEKRTGLADYSPKDKPWNRHRGNTDDIAGMYNGVSEFEKIQSNIYGCSGWLDFHWVCDTETGEAKLKLKRANFCRARHCPVCQWRRTLMWQARFHDALPKIVEEYPTSRWLFLTLTLRNCDIHDLRKTCRLINTAWRKFIRRKELKPIQGWVRTTEVTYRYEDRTAHPHFHCLLMVPPSWFTGKYYVKHARFVELWSESLGLGYDANVDIRTVKAKKGAKQTLTKVELLIDGAQETLKYATKAEDLKADKQWFLEYNRQVKGLRFMAAGGVLKDVLKPDKESNQDLITAGKEEESIGESENSSLIFHWQTERREYHKTD